MKNLTISLAGLALLIALLAAATTKAKAKAKAETFDEPAHFSANTDH